jgi:4-hydroxybenzoate polyprenyltransferase
MTFNEVMALIMPSIIALLFYSKVIRRKLTFFEGLCHLVLFMLITNSICYAISIYLNKTLFFVFSISFTMKYSIMATCVAIVIAVLYRFLELNLHINLRVESKDEEE